MIGLPPSEAGGIHDTVALALPATAIGVSTTLGGALGVTWFETPAGPSPEELVATTSKT